MVSSHLDYKKVTDRPKGYTQTFWVYSYQYESLETLGEHWNMSCSELVRILIDSLLASEGLINKEYSSGNPSRNLPMGVSDESGI